ncbi:MAG: DUF2911 domain-containing protein [Gemmatimonadales bacterium]|nr:DUF2911 domain-containing protein [Gemmatimonadales bacterium]
MRRVLAVAGLVLVIGLIVAPTLPPGALLPLSIVWLAALVALARAAYTVLAQWIGRGGALAVVFVAAATPIFLTAPRLPPHLAVRLPCHRNWFWLPAWLLRSSPMGSLTFEVDGSPAKLCYGRPALRGRKMLGGSNVPFGRLWRTGANEPTTLITTSFIVVAGVPVPSGRVALYSIPGPESWELILNQATSQWGIESEYTEQVRTTELGRAIVRSETVPESLERLTFYINGTDLVLAWERTRVRIPLAPASR